MKVFWNKHPKPGNFGDVLTPLILDHFGISYSFTKEDYDTIAIGSIASLAKPGTQVLGSGILTGNQDLSSEAAWKFVRGPLTRQRVIECGGQCPEIYGDLAMLLPLICDASKKEYDIGITPHYVDYESTVAKYPEYHVIDLLNSDPLTVVKEITKCRFIISSSLHGIICAHAYGIPAAKVEFSGNVKGDGSKFADHYAAMKIKYTKSKWNDFHFSAPTFDPTPIINVMRTIAYEQK